jgi:hypothetical protein
MISQPVAGGLLSFVRLKRAASATGRSSWARAGVIRDPRLALLHFE